MKISTIAALPFAFALLACSSQGEPQTVATGASCSSLEGSEETLAELYKPGAMYTAEPIKERIFRARAAQPERVMGATLKVRAERDMNAPYMQRVLACHAASGQGAHPNDPLVPASGTIAKLSVEKSKFGFNIQVTGQDPDMGEEIWQRAEILTNQGSRVDAEQVGGLAKTSSF